METDDQRKEIEPLLLVLGSFIKKKRRESGMSQEDLATKSSLHRTYISDVERGLRNVTIGSCFLLANGLGIKIYEIASAIDEAIPNRTSRDKSQEVDSSRSRQCPNR